MKKAKEEAENAAIKVKENHARELQAKDKALKARKSEENKGKKIQSLQTKIESLGDKLKSNESLFKSTLDVKKSYIKTLETNLNKTTKECSNLRTTLDTNMKYSTSKGKGIQVAQKSFN